jgi:hypothetical protein
MALAEAAMFPHQEGRFSMTSSHTLDQLDTRFDDTHAIANAGLLLPATLAQRLGIEQTADALIDLGEPAGPAALRSHRRHRSGGVPVGQPPATWRRPDPQVGVARAVGSRADVTVGVASAPWHRGVGRQAACKR